MRRSVGWAVGLAALALPACGNNPYPGQDSAEKVYYANFLSPPKTLDPQVSYAVSDQVVIANVYETLLEYHYLKRPYELIPGLATGVPRPEPGADGRVRYRFSLRRGVRFARDPCFGLGAPGRTTRELVAADLVFALQRIADPAVNSPAVVTFHKVEGLREFGARLAALREEEPGFDALRIDAQYTRAGAIAGVRSHSDREVEITLTAPYPQILYWFAMPFTSPVPWEAVAYYDGQRHGEEQRPAFTEVAVGTGPFRLHRYEKRNRISLVRNPDWYGLGATGAGAPGATYPGEGEAGDAERGLLRAAGRGLPFLDRVELRPEKEAIPAFNKFLQGYYDGAGIIQESFDQIVREDRLSPEMAARGMRLEKSVEPTVFYLGFNMLDPVVGAPAGERGRKLRQAMSLAVDVEEYLRIFFNGRGIPAQSPLPPGIFGYDPDYVNPYLRVDLERARALLREAGYENGIDPASGENLRLTLDTPDASSRSRQRFRFFTQAWQQLGLDVRIEATDYNQFRQKVRDGSYQIFPWGWIADYPDPENFLFLLWSEMAQAKNDGPNTANFHSPRYDEIFLTIKDLENGPERLEGIAALRAITEVERPWIELSFRESYVLYQPWLHNVKAMGISVPTLKYRDVDTAQRNALRRAWNQPIRWPAYVLAGLVCAAIVPGVVTFFRERQ